MGRGWREVKEAARNLARINEYRSVAKATRYQFRPLHVYLANLLGKTRHLYPAPCQGRGHPLSTLSCTPPHLLFQLFFPSYPPTPQPTPSPPAPRPRERTSFLNPPPPRCLLSTLPLLHFLSRPYLVFFPFLPSSCLRRMLAGHPLTYPHSTHLRSSFIVDDEDGSDERDYEAVLLRTQDITGFFSFQKSFRRIF